MKQHVVLQTQLGHEVYEDLADQAKVKASKIIVHDGQYFVFEKYHQNAAIYVRCNSPWAIMSVPTPMEG